ncbi:MAG: hypothetical protein DRQ88_06030 [Epsilonproteobacteria bacterium]|nr:MAG: hypothetical protein DRQ88_06030 [Campylobacterota bacterium]
MANRPHFINGKMKYRIDEELTVEEIKKIISYGLSRGLITREMPSKDFYIFLKAFPKLVLKEMPRSKEEATDKLFFKYIDNR